MADLWAAALICMAGCSASVAITCLVVLSRRVDALESTQQEVYSWMTHCRMEEATQARIQEERAREFWVNHGFPASDWDKQTEASSSTGSSGVQRHGSSGSEISSS